MSHDILIFDRAALRRQRERAANADPAAQFLRREIRARLVDRLADVKHDFQDVLDLGSGEGDLASRLRDVGRAANVIALDAALGFAKRQRPALVGEEEALPFKAASFDLVISTLGLHWTNDLPGALLQIRHALRPDGLLLASMYGGETLWQLRDVLIDAELALSAGAAPRVSPYADLPDMGALLQRAGFTLPVVDSERLTVTYPNLFALMADLRAMGETNVLRDRQRGFTKRALFVHAAALYRERFGDDEGRIPATFHVINLTAWAPSPTQPKPLRPGSATARLADALGTKEINAGDKVGG